MAFKILLAGITWPPETFIERLIKGVADAGAHVTVACARKPEAEWLPHPRVSWLYTPAWQGHALTRLWRTGRMMSRAALRSSRDVRLLRVRINSLDGWIKRCQMWYRVASFAGRRWDVVYFPWNSAAISHLPLFDLGMPVIVSCRGTQISVAPHNPQRREIIGGLQQTFEKAALVHCVSDDIKRQAIKFGLDARKARVIHAAVDVNFFARGEHLSGAPGTFRIINVGRLIWVKGQEYALQAIRHLADEGFDVRFDIIGDGPGRSRLMYTIEDLKLEKNVRLHGALSPGEVRAKLQQADAFLLSSLSEGLCNAVVEAKACGLPVVTTNCGGVREVVTNGVDGFVVPVREPRAMARALSTLIKDPTLCRKMRDAARSSAANDFSVDQQVEKFIQLCREVAQGSRR